MNNIQRMVDALVAARGNFYDEHMNRNDHVEAFAHFVTATDVPMVVALYAFDNFTINPFYLADDGVRLRKYSVGGVVSVALGDVKHALEEYNRNDPMSHFVAMYQFQPNGSIAKIDIPRK